MTGLACCKSAAEPPALMRTTVHSNDADTACVDGEKATGAPHRHRAAAFSDERVVRVVAALCPGGLGKAATHLHVSLVVDDERALLVVGLTQVAAHAQNALALGPIRASHRARLCRRSCGPATADGPRCVRPCRAEPASERLRTDMGRARSPHRLGAVTARDLRPVDAGRVELVASNALLSVVEHGVRLVVLDERTLIFLGGEEHELPRLPVIEPNLVEAVRDVRRRVSAIRADRLVVGERVRDGVQLVEQATAHDRLIGVPAEERNQHLLANARQLQHAVAAARPTFGSPAPSKTRRRSLAPPDPTGTAPARDQIRRHGSPPALDRSSGRRRWRIGHRERLVCR